MAWKPRFYWPPDASLETLVWRAFYFYSLSRSSPFAGFPGLWRRHIKKSIFSQSPRLSTSGLLLRHGSPRRSAKNALLYVDLGRELPWSAAAFSQADERGCISVPARG